VKKTSTKRRDIMAFKAGFVVMAPEVDPETHRASIKTPRFELTTVLVGLWNFEQAVNVCKDLVQKEAIQSLILCPGFPHEAVAKIANAVGDGVPISVARGDVPSVMKTGEILGKEGWFPQGH
jgi:hypothetical protein